MIVLIPAYEPDEKLAEVVANLRRNAPWLAILVVDDGSGPGYSAFFEAAAAEGAEVISYPKNLGKGHALKVGFTHAQLDHPGEDIVCADSDGQHRTADILRVAEELGDDDEKHMVLGGRRFAGAVPLRSRFGNSVTRRAFTAATGLAVYDTQTGLRAYPASIVPWLLAVKGERFEYELNTLLESPAAGVRVDEIEIETVYVEQNASSHFRPIVDSVRVFAPLVKYGASSIAAFVIDTVGLMVLFSLTGSLIVSVVGARIVSASVNFLVNRHVVFGSDSPGRIRREALKYVMLAGALLASNYVWLAVLTQVGLPLLAAKFITEATLYLLSFQVQRRFVFRKAAKNPDAPPKCSATSSRQLSQHV